MAKVYLTCESNLRDHPFARRDFERLMSFSSIDKKKHIVSNDPAQADIIAFIGSAKANFSDITSSRTYKTFKNKSVIFFSGDKAIPIIPGIYTSLEKKLYTRYRKTLLSGFYLRVTDNDSLDIDEDINDAEYLFSFMGNAENHPVRKRIFGLPSFRAYLRDSSIDTIQQDDGITGKNKDRGILYRNVMAKSKFVLCPRGIGGSSWRLFETMRAGRVPVIISDDWVRPMGPKWDSFSLSIRENEVGIIPDVLKKYENQAAKLGATARKEWKAWYSKDVVFTTVVDQLILAQSEIATENILLRALTYTQYFEPFFFRNWVLSRVKHHLFSSRVHIA